MPMSADRALAGRFAALRSGALATGARGEDGDWLDVLARARSARRRRSLILVAVIALAVAASAPAFGLADRVVGLLEGGEPVKRENLSTQDLRGLSAVMNHGLRVGSHEELRGRLGAVSAIRRIAVAQGRAYFVIEERDGTRCYAVGSVEADHFGQIACVPDFPSPSLPILNLAVFHGVAPAEGPNIHGDSASAAPCCLWRLEGFAADGVASVGVVTVRGDLTAITSVENNVYTRLKDLPTEPIEAFVALDHDGTRIYTECLARKGC
jgi:hypothetical protein